MTFQESSKHSPLSSSVRYQGLVLAAPTKELVGIRENGLFEVPETAHPSGLTLDTTASHGSLPVSSQTWM